MEQSNLPTPTGAHGFEQAFGESLRQILDLSTWTSGEDLPAVYEHTAREVEAAVRLENRARDRLRAGIFPFLRSRPGAPPGAGTYQVPLDDLRRVHHGLLFTGAVEACDAIQYTHETLPLTVTQIGVSLVSYHGSAGTWVHRLYRRDLRETLPDPAAEVVALLERRRLRERDDGSSGPDQLSRLARQAITAYAERAILLRQSEALWRVAQGSPAPFELLTGSAGTLDIVIEGTRLLEELICGHRRFLFVPRQLARKDLATIGAALRPMEYAIVETLADHIWEVVNAGQFYWPVTSDTTIDGKRLSPREWVLRFRDEIATQVVVGVYRASELAGPRLFFAHAEHAHEAAMLALADSVMQPARGYPALLELAGQVCESTFGPESLSAALQLAYTRAGTPLQYLTSRLSRR